MNGETRQRLRLKDSSELERLLENCGSTMNSEIDSLALESQRLATGIAALLKSRGEASRARRALEG